MIKIGTEIPVKVGAKVYRTEIDQNGVQRFPTNKFFRHLIDSGQVDLNQLAVDFQKRKISKTDYLNFILNIGYSVCGFCELSCFKFILVDNPLWDDRRKDYEN